MNVLTWNIRHGVGVDGRLDLERIARVIEEAGSDVVALQEVDRRLGERSAHVDQLAWLAERLGMHSAWATSVRRGEGRYGNALLSRARLTDVRFHELANHPGGEQRTLLVARTQMLGRTSANAESAGTASANAESSGAQPSGTDQAAVPVTVACTHLTQSSREGRRVQALEVIRLLGLGGGAVPSSTPSPAASTSPPSLPSPGGSLVLCGDLNATPDSPEIRELTRHLTDAWATTVPWWANPPGPLGAVAARLPLAATGHTMPAQRPTRRIDYVLTRGWTVEEARVIDSRASDHRPVVARLR